MNDDIKFYRRCNLLAVGKPEHTTFRWVPEDWAKIGCALFITSLNELFVVTKVDYGRVSEGLLKERGSEGIMLEMALVGGREVHIADEQR